MKGNLKKVKKYIPLFFAVGMAAGLLGCSKGNGETGKGGLEADTPRTEQENTEVSGQEETKPRLPQEMAGNYYTGGYKTMLETASIEKPLVSDKDVYYYRWLSSSTKVFKYNMETEQTTEIPLLLGERESIVSLGMNEDKNLVAVKRYYEEANEDKHYYYLLVFSEDGTILMEKEISEVIDESALTSFPNSYVYGMTVGRGSHICVHGLYMVWVFDMEGNLEFSVQTEDHIYNMGALPDGGAAASVYTYGGSKVLVLDFENQEWGDSYTSSHFDESLSFAGSDGEELYFYTAKELFSYDPESKNVSLVADWIENDILGDDICHVSVLQDGNLRVVTSDATGSGGGTETVLLKQTDVKERAQKEIITMGTIELTGGMRSAVTSFNRRSDKYRVEVIEYAQGSTYQNYRDGVKLFNAEVSAGNMPDVMNITDGTEEFYAAKGIFEDLKPYMDGENGIDRNEYFDNILTAMETEGKLYALSPDFSIKTLVGKTSDVGEGYSWTLDDIAALEESRDENTELLFLENGREILYLFLRYNLAQFFDLNAGLCDFDNEDFKKIIEFAGRFPLSNPYHDGDPSEMLRANEGDLLLIQAEFTHIRAHQMYRQFFNGDISCVGYPGRFSCGSVAKGGDVTLVMSEKSRIKEGAWEVIRFFLEKEYQHKYTTYFPVLRSAYDRRAAEAMWIDYETGEKQESGSTMGGGSGDISVFVEDIPREEVEEVTALIEKIERMERIDEQALNIILEETGAYFAGQKTVDEVVSIIQSRASIYMNENR